MGGIEQMSEEFGVRTVDAGDHVVVVVAGEVDIESQARLGATLEAARAEGRCLVVDLYHTTFADRTAVEVLLRAHLAQAAGGGSLVLRAPPERLARMLRVLGLHTVLAVDPAPRTPVRRPPTASPAPPPAGGANTGSVPPPSDNRSPRRVTHVTGWAHGTTPTDRHRPPDASRASASNDAEGRPAGNPGASSGSVGERQDAAHAVEDASGGGNGRGGRRERASDVGPERHNGDGSQAVRPGGDRPSGADGAANVGPSGPGEPTGGEGTHGGNRPTAAAPGGDSRSTAVHPRHGAGSPPGCGAGRDRGERLQTGATCGVTASRRREGAPSDEADHQAADRAANDGDRIEPDGAHQATGLVVEGASRTTGPQEGCPGVDVSNSGESREGRGGATASPDEREDERRTTRGTWLDGAVARTDMTWPDVAWPDVAWPDVAWPDGVQPPALPRRVPGQARRRRGPNQAHGGRLTEGPGDAWTADRGVTDGPGNGPTTDDRVTDGPGNGWTARGRATEGPGDCMTPGGRVTEGPCDGTTARSRPT